MPAGKVKYYNAERGFGFIIGDDGEEVFLHVTALPEGVVPKPGTNVEYSVADGRKGPSALNVLLKDPLPSVVKAKRPAPAQMGTIVEDLVKLLDRIGDGLKAGKYPEGRTAQQTAAMLRAVADQLDSV